MTDTAPAKTGIDAVDRMLLRALDQGLMFPPSTSRWRLLAWAAESAELERRNPTDFQRAGFRRIFQEHFPPRT